MQRRVGPLQRQKIEAKLRERLAYREDMIKRGATHTELAFHQQGDYELLLSLDQVTRARDLVLSCWPVMSESPQGNSLVFNALAEIEHALDNTADAITLQRWALTFGYLFFTNTLAHFEDRHVGYEVITGATSNIMRFHLTLASLLVAQPGEEDGDLALDHAFAACIIGKHVKVGYGASLGTLARLIRTISNDDALPLSAEDLSERIERIRGVSFSAMFDVIARGRQTMQDAVLELVTEITPYVELDAWAAQVLPILIEAAQGDEAAMRRLEPILVDLQKMSQWQAVASSFRRLIAGERNEESLTRGLDIVTGQLIADALAKL